MANSLMVGFDNGSGDLTQSSTTQSFWMFNGCLMNFKSSYTSSGNTESFTEIEYTAGTLSNLWVRVVTAASSTSTALLRHNAANGNETISISASTGTFTDTTHTDSISSGDKIDMAVTPGSTALHIEVAAVVFAASSNTVTIGSAINGAVPNYNASTTSYLPPIGIQSYNSGATTTEADTECRTQVALTVSTVSVNVDTASSSTTVHGRVNAANGNISITFSASGISADTTHTDSLSSTNTYDYSIVTGASSVTLNGVGGTFSSSSGYTIFSCSCDQGQSTIAKSTTIYFGLAGDLETGDSTESDTEVLTNNTFTFSDLDVNVQANTVSATSTVTLRANAASPSNGPSASITSSGTGHFTDTTHTYAAAATDEIDQQVVTGSSGTSMTLQNINIFGQLSSGSTIPNFFDWARGIVFVEC
jgi:hypothetical protein